MNKRNVILTHGLESQAEFVLGFCVAGAYVMFVKSVGLGLSVLGSCLLPGALLG